MKPPKAIEILTLMGTPDFEGHTEDILAARKLGIEALKREKANRDNPDFVMVGELPGETLDEPTTQAERLKRGEELLDLGAKSIAEGKELLSKDTSSL